MSTGETPRHVRSCEFRIEHLGLSDVWTWSTDLQCSEDVLIPVAKGEQTRVDADSFLIHSRFRTASGKTIVGLAILQAGGDEVFAVILFVDQQTFCLNKHLPDLSIESLAQLAAPMDDQADHLLPLESEIVPDGWAIKRGTFSFPPSV